MKAPDEGLVRRAMERQVAGLSLSNAEAQALRVWERLERERVAWEVYAAVPKKHYCEMSGRQVKVVNEQAERYGLDALLGPTVDLRKLLRQVHDFFAKYGARFAQAVDEEAVMAAGLEKGSPAAERYREMKADIEEMKRDGMYGELLPRAEMRKGLAAVASTIRIAGERLEREYGPGAREILDEALDEAEDTIDALFPRKQGDGEAA